MAKLLPQHPLAGRPALEAEGLRLSVEQLGPITSLMPYRGQEAALSSALARLYGLSWPDAGWSAKGDDGALCLWSGRAQGLLIGPKPDVPQLERVAAVVDHSDAWKALRLTGPRARDVLARLVPVDLRLPDGRCLRSPLQHVPAVILCEADGVMILVPRSMAGTAWEDLTGAIARCTAR